MFGTILIAAGAWMHFYVFWRAASVPLVKRHVPRTVLIGAAVLLWAGFFFGRIYGHGGAGDLARLLELIGMTWMGVLFLCSVCLLAADLISGFGFFLPRLAPSLRGWGLAAGGVLCVIALVQGLRPPVIQNYEEHLYGLPREMDGMVIVAISDLHLGGRLGERWLEARIAQVQAEQPDLVVVLGDLFEGHSRPERNLLAGLRRLHAPLGVWAVRGNHEFHGVSRANMSLVEGDGFTVLSNRRAEVRPGLVLASVEDLTAIRRSRVGGDPFSKVLPGRPPGVTIFLSHTPWQADRAANDGVGLMLSGHTHGGQIWPFGYLVRLVYPLVGGRYEVGGMTVLVCRGTGTWGPRMRLWRRSEILRVTLREKAKP